MTINCVETGLILVDVHPFHQEESGVAMFGFIVSIFYFISTLEFPNLDDNIFKGLSQVSHKSILIPSLRTIISPVV